jgi:hypothetical protein
VTKLILATRSTDVSGLLDPAFRGALAAAGATAVQVNVDDDAVGPALRFGPGEPITALVSLWTPGLGREPIELVAEAAGDRAVHAYRVTERVRLDPIPVEDGVRADVLAQVAILRRPESMSRADYLDYWMVKHTPIAIRTQNTSGYIQNIVEELLTPDTPPAAAIVEEHFPMGSMTDPHEFYGSRGDDQELERRMTELMASVARFGADQGLDLMPTSRYQWSL